MRVMQNEFDIQESGKVDRPLEAKATWLHELVKHRENHFRRSAMADAPMAIMLTLFLSELRSVSLSEASLSLTNLIDAGEAESILENLAFAGLVVVTEENSGRRSVGLTALGSARMRSYVSDFPEV